MSIFKSIDSDSYEKLLTVSCHSHAILFYAIRLQMLSYVQLFSSLFKVEIRARFVDMKKVSWQLYITKDVTKLTSKRVWMCWPMCVSEWRHSIFTCVRVSWCRIFFINCSTHIFQTQFAVFNVFSNYVIIFKFNLILFWIKFVFNLSYHFTHCFVQLFVFEFYVVVVVVVAVHISTWDDQFQNNL